MPEPDLLADSIAAPQTERLRLTAHGERPEDVYARANVASFALLNGSDSIAVRELRSALQHQPQADHDLVRERAAWALLSAGGGGVVLAALDSLASPNWRVRAYASWTLGVAVHGASRNDRVAPALIIALDDPIWRVRSAAAFALQSIGDTTALPAMRRALTDAAWQVRYSALEFLGRFGRTQDRSAVMQRLNDRHEVVRSGAVAALSSLTQ